MASLTDPMQQDRHPSPGLVLPLSSNNPFRNPRVASPALSPALPSPASAPGVLSPSPRIVATNPFLSPSEISSAQQTGFPLPVVGDSTMQAQHRPSVAADQEAAQLFHRLTLMDNGPIGGAPLVKTSTTNSLNGVPPSGHKPSRSDEAERRRDPRDPRMRPRPRPNGPSEELDIFASPEKRERRPRRNSESSVMSKPAMTEEEKRRRERRRREAEARGETPKDGKARDPSKPRSSRRKQHRGMDLIDQLDQTGIYGAGFFHHDGPFDAVNPHRNRRKDDRAPMRAFPAGSKNMMLGGAGPLNKGIDLERFHGLGAEGFTDYGNTAPEEYKKKVTASFDPTARVDPVHGEETYGLGTSTFLEGAPASRKAIERRESETQFDGSQGGLQRKKSLAQRIRGMSRNDRPGARAYGGGPLSPGATSPSMPADRLVQSAGGPSRTTLGDRNPFDTMYDDAFDKKGAAIKIAEQEREVQQDVIDTVKPGRPRAPSSPHRNALQRSGTSDSIGEDPEGKRAGGGFLNRVKSLKGGRHGRHVS